MDHTRAIWSELFQGYRVTGGVIPAEPDSHEREPLRKIWVHPASVCTRHGDELRIANNGNEQWKRLCSIMGPALVYDDLMICLMGSGGLGSGHSWLGQVPCATVVRSLQTLHSAVYAERSSNVVARYSVQPLGALWHIDFCALEIFLFTYLITYSHLPFTILYTYLAALSELVQEHSINSASHNK